MFCISKDNIDFKSYDEQIETIKEKNIVVKNEEAAKEILKNYSYYTLINGYKSLFLIPGEDDKMVNGTTFEDFYVSHLMYITLYSILLKYLQVIENDLRTNLSHIIARDYGTDDQKYMDSSNFVSHKLRKKTLHEINSVINQPDKKSHSYYFKYQKKCSIPPWILFKDIKFYNVISVYAISKDEHRKEIRGHFLDSVNSIHQENIKFFNTFQFLREYRNLFAHSGRDFDEKFNFSVHIDIIKTLYPETHNELIYIDYYNGNNSTSLYDCMLLIYKFLKDPLMRNYFIIDLVNFFNEFIDTSTNEPKTLFINKTAFDILRLPNDFITRVENSFVMIT